MCQILSPDQSHKIFIHLKVWQWGNSNTSEGSHVTGALFSRSTLFVRKLAHFLNLPWKWSTHTWSEGSVASTWNICLLLPKVKVLNCVTWEVSTTLHHLAIFSRLLLFSSEVNLPVFETFFHCVACCVVHVCRRLSHFGVFYHWICFVKFNRVSLCHLKRSLASFCL